MGSARPRNWNGSWTARGVEPLHGLLRAVVAQRALEQVAGEVHPALQQVLAGGQQVGELPHDRLGLARLDRGELGDLGGDRLHLLLAHVGEDLRGTLLAEAHQDDRGLAGAVPGHDAHQGRSTSQPRSSAATSSGCRSTRATSSSRIPSTGSTTGASASAVGASAGLGVVCRAARATCS